MQVCYSTIPPHDIWIYTMTPRDLIVLVYIYDIFSVRIDQYPILVCSQEIRNFLVLYCCISNTAYSYKYSLFPSSEDCQSVKISAAKLYSGGLNDVHRPPLNKVNCHWKKYFHRTKCSKKHLVIMIIVHHQKHLFVQRTLCKIIKQNEIQFDTSTLPQVSQRSRY